jgi:hypothetical protein
MYFKTDYVSLFIRIAVMLKRLTKFEVMEMMLSLFSSLIKLSLMFLKQRRNLKATSKLQDITAGP